jgi:hypothetical protein
VPVSRNGLGSLNETANVITSASVSMKDSLELCPSK